MTTKKLVQFGAGNIGRSFIGQLFSRAGYEVVFVDVNDELVSLINERRRYRVLIKRNDRDDETVWVENVRAINGNDRVAVAGEIADASFLATSVGKGALRHVFPVIAQGLAARRETNPGLPLDIIIAENIRDGAAWFAEELRALLPEGFLDGRKDAAVAPLGLVETSIGKMVPIMRSEDLAADPLQVFAEEYNELIVDKNGFRGTIPDFVGMKPVSEIRAYVDRKLFVHNLGHAAAAYLGFRNRKEARFIWEVLEDRGVFDEVQEAMRESAGALVLEYPSVFSAGELEGHIQDLLFRFRNRALGDTVFRVGRDLYRKLDREDRLIGAIILAQEHGLAWPAIARAVRAACSFDARDENGLPFRQDSVFMQTEVPKGIRGILTDVSHLDPAIPGEKIIVDTIACTA